MRSEIHPEYRTVAFQDTSEGTTFLIPSTAESGETTIVDGLSTRWLKLKFLLRVTHFSRARCRSLIQRVELKDLSAGTAKVVKRVLSRTSYR